MRRDKEISAALWKKLKPLLPEVKPSHKGGRPRLEDELALNGILFELRTGIPWEDLPQELGFGSDMTCWRRLRDWHSDGVWHRLNKVSMKPAAAHRGLLPKNGLGHQFGEVVNQNQMIS